MCPIPMKQLSHLLILLFLLIHFNSKAQTDIRQDSRVDPVLKQVDTKHPGLLMFTRKDDGEKYVNMAVLSDSARTLTWFTCYGQAFDVVRLNDDVYSRIKSGSLDPFNYYKDYFFDLLSLVRTAAAQFRQMGKATLNDTDNIYHRVYTYPPVRQARSTLQKQVAMEKLMSDRCLQLSLFDSRTPQQLPLSDSFQLRLQLAGRMIRKGDTITYYNTNPLSSAARIVLRKPFPGKMFVYDLQGQLADSVPLKADKYATLLNEKEDVFLLYRGWLELQSQQAIAGKDEVARLLNREHTMLYKPVYWEQNKQHLQRTFLEVQKQVDAIGSKIMGLIVPPQEETAQLLAAVYRDKPAEISYMPGLGFAYSVAYMRGHKRYELSDHRGNVMAVVSDRKKLVDENTDGVVEYYNADIVSAVDYLPFGGQMPGRTYSVEDKYRYGFNGKENDNEVKGEGNQQDYGMRIYDGRVGRFLSVDPITSKYPGLTPYQFASNRPIDGIDLDGQEYLPYIATFPSSGGRGVMDYINAANNGAIDVINIVPTLWNGSVETYKALRRGTYIHDLSNEGAQVGSGLKKTAVNLWVNPIETVTSPEALRLGVGIYVGAKVPLPVKGNKGNLLKPISTATTEAAGIAESQFFKQGGSTSILDGAGNMNLNVKTGMLEGSFVEGGQTVIFDAKVSINGKNISFKEVGIYGETGYGTTAAQNAVKPSTYRNLMKEIETQVKQGGFESGTIDFKRVRPEGSKLPDSEPRSIPLKLD